MIDLSCHINLFIDCTYFYISLCVLIYNNKLYDLHEYVPRVWNKLATQYNKQIYSKEQQQHTILKTSLKENSNKSNKSGTKHKTGILNKKAH